MDMVTNKIFSLQFVLGPETAHLIFYLTKFCVASNWFLFLMNAAVPYFILFVFPVAERSKFMFGGCY